MQVANLSSEEEGEVWLVNISKDRVVVSVSKDRLAVSISKE